MASTCPDSSCNVTSTASTFETEASTAYRILAQQLQQRGWTRYPKSCWRANDKTFHHAQNDAKIPTENHLKIRRVIDAGSKWELDLEKVHGLTDEEACIVVSKVARYGNEDTFPDANGDRFMELAKEGWKYSRELPVARLHKLYPECTDQTCINGEWVMTLP